MKMIKSLLAAALAICLVACLAVPAFAETEPTTEPGASVATTNPSGDTAESVGADDTTAPSDETDPSEDKETEPVETEDHTGHDHDDTTTTGEEEEEETGVLKTILIVLELIASIILVVVVLMQSGKESGLSSSISGNSDSYMSKSGKGCLDKKLAKATKWVALAWIVLTLVLSLI